MTHDLYKGLLSDIVMEINEIALDKSIWKETEFDRGYRAGMMVIMKVVQDELRAFNLNNKDVLLIDVDEWFRLGKDYDPS